MKELRINPDLKYDRTISVRILNKDYEKLCYLAQANNTNIAVIVRYLLHRGIITNLESKEYE